MFLILLASNALDGTLLDYRPPTIQVWERGVWDRGTWGMNDEFAAPSTPSPTTTTPRAYTLLRKRRRLREK